MHPWKKIINGNTEELETKACFLCLERLPPSDDDIEMKLHLFKVHSAKVHLKELVVMCTEAEEKEEREGWSINDILEEERDRREAEERKRAESGGWMVMFRKNKTPEFLDNEETENNELDCFLCQKIVQRCEYNEHLENQHGVIFGVKEIMMAREKYQSFHPNKETVDHETGEAGPKIIRTDADTVKEMVEMKYLKKKSKTRIRRFQSKTEIILKKKPSLIE